MKLELSAKECEYLADKTFWDWQRAKIDVMSTPLILKDNQQFVEAVKEAEQFLRELHNKLNPQWEERKNEQGICKI